MQSEMAAFFFYKIIKNEGKSAILVTHDISEALCYKVQPVVI